MSDDGVAYDINGPATGDCPPATQDIELNLRNRKNAIDTAMYGPLNPAEPNDEYWQSIGSEWGVDVETAKQQRCGNCAVFVVTPSMKECIADGLTGNRPDDFDSIDAAGELGYCEAFDFKCASARTCRAWVSGGPVTEEKAPEAEASIDEIEDSLTAASGPCWEGYVQIGMKKGQSGKMVPNCVPKDSAAAKDFASKTKRTVSQTPAPKKDQIKGSSKNKKGSASGEGKVTFSKTTETSLRNKVEAHNKTAPKGRRATLGMLKAVYRRGAGAYSVSHRPGMSRNQWAMGRVNAFLRLLKSGKPAKSSYTTDNDLLPAGHPRSTKKKSSTMSKALTASGLIPEEQALAEALAYITEKYGKFDQDGDGVWAGYSTPEDNDVKDIGVKCSNCVFYQGGDQCKIIALPVAPEGKCRFAVIPEGVVDISQVPVRDPNSLELLLADAYAMGELNVEIKDNIEDYDSPEEVILNMCEFAGLGYEAEPAFRASWLRAVRNDEDPFVRVRHLATMKYDSLDADLLPNREVLG